ncbi:MAG: metal ABC transporter permease [Mobilibacterium timonense]|uniref:metal ABC transporter permease n=1 Tax=Mobilibacterium timonense TaxID=1871012 RepID=UPI00098468A3|nr:metal ABC transporter permease [Mobilibacterium timonense]MBM6990530.1 metal ABC transporter permease [Mobilibacterium timonense]
MNSGLSLAFEYLRIYPFVRYAVIVGVLVSLAASLLGVTLVLKRFSFIGDGLSHVAFGAISIATVMHFTSYVQFTLPVTIICAILILRTGRDSKINGDAVIAMLSVASLAVGYMVMNVFGASSNLSGDVCTTLFGSTSILTLSRTEVTSTVILATVVVGIFVLFYNKLFAVTFDEDFARASGTNTEAYNLLIAVVVAVVIVIAMDLVGSLLISALIIFPALSAMRMFNSFKSVTICSGVLAVISSLTGMLISIVAGTPVGATIVCTQIVMFAVSCAAGSTLRRGAA